MEYPVPINHCLLAGNGKDVLINQLVIRHASQCQLFTYLESPQALPSYFTQSTSISLPNWIFIDLTDRWIEIHIVFSTLLKHSKTEPAPNVVLISDGSDSLLAKLLSNAGISFSLLSTPLSLPLVKKVLTPSVH